MTEQELFSKHAYLVRRQALSIQSKLPANIELDDLIQAGMIGLLDAIRRYEFQEDAKFETYANTRIRGAIYDELRQQDWLPRTVRDKSKQIEQGITEARAKLLKEPSEIEVAKELDMPLEDYQKMLQESQGAQLLMYEDLVELYNNNDMVDIIFKDTESNPLEILSRVEFKELLAKAIESLPEKEKLVLALQFDEDLNQKEVSEVLNVTEGRISQLRSQAISRIRSWLKDNSWAADSRDMALIKHSI